ncbi:MAG: hypothetical protein ABIP94_17445 [Planctomycetota bacterium]
MRLRTYLAQLTTGRTILWCYAIWYAVNVAQQTGTTALDRWQVFRLFLMPFCVLSFAALVKDAGYVLVFPPSLQENARGFALIAAFVVLVRTLRAKPVATTH